MLAKSFDPAKHPHWPGGSPNSVGGRFEPVAADEFGPGDTRQPPQATDRRPVAVPPSAWLVWNVAVKVIDRHGILAVDDVFDVNESGVIEDALSKDLRAECNGPRWAG